MLERGGEERGGDGRGWDILQGCGNSMPDLSKTGNFDDGQVEFSC